MNAKERMERIESILMLVIQAIYDSDSKRPTLKEAKREFIALKNALKADGE